MFLIMSTNSSPSASSLAAHRAKRDAYFQHVLTEAIELGAERLAAMAQEADSPKESFAKSYDLIMRNMHRAMQMVRKLDEPEKAGAARRRVVARRQVIRAVEDRIAAEAPERAESLHAELLERLDAPEFEDDLAEMRWPEVVANTCRDLGLGDVEGLRRTPAEVAVLNARAAAPAGAMPREGAFDPVAAPGRAPKEAWRKAADPMGRGWRTGRGPVANAPGGVQRTPITDAELEAILYETEEEKAEKARLRALWAERRVQVVGG